MRGFSTPPVTNGSFLDRIISNPSVKNKLPLRKWPVYVCIHYFFQYFLFKRSFPFSSAVFFEQTTATQLYSSLVLLFFTATKRTLETPMELIIHHSIYICVCTHIRLGGTLAFVVAVGKIVNVTNYL